MKRQFAALPYTRSSSGGEAIRGQLYDIGGSSPLKITLKTASGERELSSSEISHIVLARPSNAVPTGNQGEFRVDIQRTNRR